MTLKELEYFVTTVINISNKTTYNNSLAIFRNSWNTYLAHKKTVPQNATSQQNINSAILQAESQKNNLINAAQQIRLELEKLSNFPLKENFNKFFGESFINFINSVNQATIESEMPKLIQLQSEYQQIAQISNAVNALGVSITNVDLENNDLIQISFAGQASVETLKDFSRQSDKWNQTINLISRVARENNTDITIQSVEKGSLILIVAAASSIVVVLCKAIDKIQDVILKHIDIQKKTFELRKLQVDGFDEILKKLEQQAKTNLNKESNDISDILLTDYGWNEDDELYNETKNATKKAVKSLITFTNKGGGVKGYLQNANGADKKIITLVNEKDKKIRQLEQDIKELTSGKQTLLIEYLPSDDDENHKEETNPQIT